MQPSSKTAKKQTQAALAELGYKPELVQLAMKESQTKSLEECLDLLLFREDEYKLLLQCKNKPKLTNTTQSDPSNGQA